MGQATDQHASSYHNLWTNLRVLCCESNYWMGSSPCVPMGYNGVFYVPLFGMVYIRLHSTQGCAGRWRWPVSLSNMSHSQLVGISFIGQITFGDDFCKTHDWFHWRKHTVVFVELTFILFVNMAFFQAFFFVIYVRKLCNLISGGDPISENVATFVQTPDVVVHTTCIGK